MFRRRPLLRAAVVGGGAYMAGKSVARNRAAQDQAEAEQDDRISQLEQQQQGYPPQDQQGYPPQQPYPPQQGYPPQQPYPSQQSYPPQQPYPPQQGYPSQPAPAQEAPAGASPMIDQLNQLASLHQQGVLSDDEFAAAKAKLLGT